MMHNRSTRWQFALFFLSGFSGLVYQIVWLRLAFAAFGVVTPVISLVLSVFMFGLGVGSWLAGSAVRRWPLSRNAALRAYAIAEALIGVGGFAVPLLFAWGQEALLPAGESNSTTYLASSAVVIFLTLAPFCLCMGVTFPFMLQAIREEQGREDSFSYLYLANVLGAMLGTAATPLALVELFGFRGTLAVAIGANWLAALVSFRKSVQPATLSAGQEISAAESESPVPETERLSASRFALLVLFATGLTSLGMEVVWTRAFTPVLQTQVYSFAGLLFTYLLATWCGSALYRRHLKRSGPLSTVVLLSLLALAATGQLLLADPRVNLPGNWLQSAWLLLGIVPYCGVLGYLTPKLIDEYSRGRPAPAGHAYAINVVGCIVGPLLASYVLLPWMGVQWSGISLAIPLWMLAGFALRSRPHGAAGRSLTAARICWGGASVCGVLAATVGTSYEDQYADRGATVMRDHTATVIAVDEDGGKQLLVNGKLITSITPTTKIMAHLPLTFVSEEPRNALVICFGMGTTYRSLLSWEIETTAVELVPSVRDAFEFYFEDAEQVRNNSLGQIVIDDGRRFLERTEEQFDVITLDPPPPPEAAGSSLLYSREFCRLAKSRLTDQGILHHWYPGGDLGIFLAVVRSVALEFQHVRVFRAFDGWGYHILASEHPIPNRSVDDLVARLPESARADLLEWSANTTAGDLLRPVLDSEINVQDLLSGDRDAVVTDDRPYNEYYLLRRSWERWTGAYTIVL
ncbi:MAG: hypothetical protein DWQ34_13965 [Planctomycetota bacterium]|nr:MAG: hypothetical protein DWQ29_22065 [Planctomycetota bacterium]REJ91885.1 MAG: hypothetical protein DWQ34_13965 [Planctomycetota bacterium]REK26722.1 MAG: hypothetical protein DWQ41_09265 [Planctomycetota bacterium]REK35617.1 MAG: hypothetical protein DWQ45_10690 [Planctomycetota bacterium]